MSCLSFKQVYKLKQKIYTSKKEQEKQKAKKQQKKRLIEKEAQKEKQKNNYKPTWSTRFPVIIYFCTQELFYCQKLPKQSDQSKGDSLKKIFHELFYLFSMDEDKKQKLLVTSKLDTLIMLVLKLVNNKELEQLNQ